MTPNRGGDLNKSLDIAPSSLWKKYPRSNIFNQHEWLGNLESPTERVDVVKTRLDEDCSKKLNLLLGVLGVSMDRLFLSICHLLLQHYLKEDESIIGLYLAPKDSKELETRNTLDIFNILIGASNIYAETDEDFEDVLSQINLDEKNSDLLELDKSGLYEYAEYSCAPTFFYATSDLSSVNYPKSFLVFSSSLGEDEIEIQLQSRIGDQGAELASKYLEDFSEVLRTLFRNGGGCIEDIYAAIHSAPNESPSSEKLVKMMADLGEIWASLLNIQTNEIKPKSSYFDLGGTSLNAFKLVNIIRSRYSVDLNIREIIECEYLEDMAKVLVSKQAKN